MFGLMTPWRKEKRMMRPREEFPLARMRDEFETLFNRFFAPFPFEPLVEEKWLWEVDVKETEKDVTIRAEVPGFEIGDFEVHVAGDRLVIRAEHKEEKKEEKEKFYRTEEKWGRYERFVPLPEGVLAEKADARYRNGVLEVTLPKAEVVPPKAIEVKS